jgi:hypothetical protein
LHSVYYFGVVAFMTCLADVEVLASHLAVTQRQVGYSGSSSILTR